MRFGRFPVVLAFTVAAMFALVSLGRGDDPAGAGAQVAQNQQPAAEGSKAKGKAAAKGVQKKAAPKKAAPAVVEPPYPPTLSNGKTATTDTAPEFLQAPEGLLAGVTVAKTVPTIDFVFLPGQDYPGKPWSNWGDGVAANGKYYTAIGDHLAVSSRGDPAYGTGRAYVYEYDPQAKTARILVDTAKFLNMPAGHYAPGKIHSRIDVGSDGWLYYATHRGSAAATTDEYHYQGDWIFRTNPQSGATEVVVHGPVPKHCIPNSVLDPDRMIFYGGTAQGSGSESDGIQFFAYDVKNKKMLYSGPNGPARYMALARSTGKLYFVPGNADGQLMRYDPQSGGPPVPVEGKMIGIRAATQETADGFIYTVSIGQRAADAAVWSLNTKTEEVKQIGTVAIGSNAYVATVDVDPNGRYLYYTAGAHGGSQRDGSGIVQFDVKTGQKKILAFVHPYYQDKYGATMVGTYSTAVDPAGDKLYITWNVNRGTRAWDSCGIMTVHIPASERQP